MSEIKNLMSDEAVEKLKSLVDDTPTCMFGSRLGQLPVHVCPMHVQEVDKDGALWFFSGANSEHNSHINADAKVQLIFGNPGKNEFITVFGVAEISRDDDKIAELWNPIVSAWFPGGKTDPNLTLIKVNPAEAHYWDTQDGKLISMAKILVASVTGKMSDAGVEGDLKV